MRPNNPRIITALSALAGLAVAFPARAQLDAIVFDGAIAVQEGQPAPGTGGSFASFPHVSLNDAGAIAFVATVTGGSASQGVFVRAGGSTTAVALAGQTAPGTGGTFSAFHSVSLNDAGDVAFEALATGTFWPEGSGEGVFRSSGGNVAKVALGGEVAFASVRYSRLEIGEVALGDGGHVAFLSQLDDCPTCWMGIFRADGAGQIALLAIAGSSTSFDLFGSLDIDGAGNVVFAAYRNDGVEGIFRDATGTSVAALQGDDALDTGGSYGQQSFCPPPSDFLFGSVELNDAGQVAFRADYSGGTAPSSGRNGLFLDTAGSDAAIVTWGSAVPGGGSFGCVSPLEGGVAINEAGAAAFWAAVDSGADGIFLRSGGTTVSVAREGGSLPGQCCLIYFGFSPVSVQLDDAGRVAFVVQFLLAGDSDCDCIPDVLDKCMQDSRNAALDCDTDRDGYGNVCDGDFNQSGSVTAADYGMFFVPALQNQVATPQGADMNCSGAVTAADYSMFFVPELNSTTPGPSGMGCAGAIPCN